MRPRREVYSYTHRQDPDTIRFSRHYYIAASNNQRHRYLSGGLLDKLPTPSRLKRRPVTYQLYSYPYIFCIPRPRPRPRTAAYHDELERIPIR